MKQQTPSHILVMVANYWGIGKTAAEAFSQIKKVRGSKPRKTEAQVWLACAEGTRIDEMGSSCYPSDGIRPIEVYIRKDGRSSKAVELDRRSEFAA
jgi:hypothetical protein